MAKLTEYSAATVFDSNDIIIKDGTSGTKKMLVQDAAVGFAGLVSANEHKNTYRGKKLGTSVSDAQKEAIRSGTFDDMFIGDYWVINGTRYYIADMNYWYNQGDNEGGFKPNHLVMLPEGYLYKAKMNNSNTTSGGYVGSYMYTAGLTQAKTTIRAAFGDLLLTHRDYFVNAVDNGHPSNAAWFDSEVDLMNEAMVFGCRNGMSGAYYSTFGSMDNRQLAIFRLANKHYGSRKHIWLRDIASATQFMYFNFDGLVKQLSATTECGVRPVFAIGVAASS